VGHPWKEKEVTIPVSQIDHIEEKVVYLKVDKKPFPQCHVFQ
jgi:hypothetical protein